MLSLLSWILLGAWAAIGLRWAWCRYASKIHERQAEVRAEKLRDLAREVVYLLPTLSRSGFFAVVRLTDSEFVEYPIVPVLADDTVELLLERLDMEKGAATVVTRVGGTLRFVSVTGAESLTTDA